MTDLAYKYLKEHYVRLLKKHLEDKWDVEVSAKEIILSALFRLAYDEGLIETK